MGAVWLAHRSDGRYAGRVAVKLLNLALLGRAGADRFKREGSALARLAHPNIARLIDAGVTSEGQPYLVLEYVEGESLDRWCESRALDVRARVRLFLQVLDAVAHAHSKLILHRDLKPANILVTPQGQVKLLDFGIAKLLDERPHATSSALTKFPGQAFTPEYAAPEQVQGVEVTTATDVYALGVLLYSLLTSRHPTADPSQTPIDRLRAVVDIDPIRPSETVRALRGDLDNIIAKALKKVPSERYGTVARLATICSAIWTGSRLVHVRIRFRIASDDSSRATGLRSVPRPSRCWLLSRRRAFQCGRRTKRGCSATTRVLSRHATTQSSTSSAAC